MVSARTGGAAAASSAAAGATGAGEPSRPARNSPTPRSSASTPAAAADSHHGRVDTVDVSITMTRDFLGAASPRRAGEHDAPSTTSPRRALWHPSGTGDTSDPTNRGRSQTSPQ